MQEKYQSDPVRAHPNRCPDLSPRGSRLDAIATEQWQTAAPTNKYCDSLAVKNAKANVLALGNLGVCRDLAVRYVLQGNVQKLGAQWRVSLQLFDATTRKIAFSEKHDFKLENVFDVQDEIGARVAASLQSRFSVAAPKKARERYSSDSEAYAEFMMGLHESTSHIQATIESAVQTLICA